MSPMELAMQEIRARQQAGEQGQFLGGSTGARLFDVPQGRFVSKRGNSPAHIRNEYEMNRLLNLLGVGVPQAHFDDDHMITEYQQGRHIQPTRDRAHTARDIVPHAMIANWDMLGLDNDNAIVLPDGSISYVDVGGAGAFRAQGAPKGLAFGSTVGELDTLRLKNPNELGHITEQDIGRSYDTYGGEDAMRSAIDQAVQNPYTASILQQRVGDIARRDA